MDTNNETPGWTQVINTISRETFGTVLRAELISGVSSLLIRDPRGESPAGHPHVPLATLSTQPPGRRWPFSGVDSHSTGPEASPLGLSTPACSHISEARAALQTGAWAPFVPILRLGLGTHWRTWKAQQVQLQTETGGPGLRHALGLWVPTGIFSSLLLLTMTG